MESSSLSRSEMLSASPRMFDNPVLDALSRVHPVVPPLIFVPAIVITFLMGADRIGTANALLSIVIGYVLWTLAEYWIHRLIFHFEPESGLGARLHWIVHGVHHDHPNDPMRLVMPPGASIPIALAFTGLFVLLVGSPEWMPFEAGFLAGYLIYDMTHYYLPHHRPTTSLGKRMRELHMRHHFQDDTTGYGVSAPWWDHVFRTATRVRAPQR